MDESQRELNERIAAEERDALDENTRRYKGGYALGRNDGVREVFDALIAAARANDSPNSWDEVTYCEVDDYGHTGKRRMCTLEQWITNQREAITDGD